MSLPENDSHSKKKKKKSFKKELNSVSISFNSVGNDLDKMAH